MSRTERTEMLIGERGIKALAAAKVMVFGIGGVGGFTCEALARAGVGQLHLVDGDCVSESNINRQIIATYDTIGQPKVDVMERRILSINPQCVVKSFDTYYIPGDEVWREYDFTCYDYVVDAIDMVASKIDIITRCRQSGVPVISSMGTGNKMNPNVFRIDDISKTSVCPLAKAVRKQLRRNGIENGVKVLFSEEEPIKTGERTPGSISFVPATAGMLIGGQVISDLLENEALKNEVK